MTATGSPSDPLSTLREYRQLAPWNLRDLVAIVGAILETTGITPINAAATALPSERTVRFYVTRGLMTPPDGRGTAATYGYRHLLQLLWIKLKQMEGTTLQQIEIELGQTTGDVLERRVAAALGPQMPAPAALDPAMRGHPVAGRSGRMFQVPGPSPEAAVADSERDNTWHRIRLDSGIELHVNEQHPLASHSYDGSELANVVRAAVSRFLGGSQLRPQRANSDTPPEQGKSQTG